jgi:PAS domain S-box-containing protein
MLGRRRVQDRSISHEFDSETFDCETFDGGTNRQAACMNGQSSPLRDEPQGPLGVDALTPSAAMSEAHSRLESTLATGEVGTWEFDVGRNAVWADRNLARMFDVSREEAAGGPLDAYLRAIHPEDRKRVTEVIAQVLTRGETFEAEYRLVGSRNPGAPVRWVVARGRVERDADDRAVRLPGVVVDVTRQRQTQLELRASEERRRLALEAAEAGAWNIDLATNSLTSDERFRTIFHGSTAPIEYEEAFAAIHPDDRQRVRDGVAAATRSEDPAAYAEEYRVIHPDGSVHWVFGKGRAHFEPTDGGRRLSSFDGTVVEISDRKRAEEAAREAQSRLESTLAAGEVGTWEFDIVNNVVRADQNLARMFGVTAEEAAGGPIQAYLRSIHPDDRERVNQAITRALETEDRYEAGYRIVGSDGGIRWVIARGRIERDASGRALGLPGVIVDVSRQREAEAEVDRLAAEADRQRRSYDTVLSNSADFNYTFDLDGRFTYVNKALLDLWQKTLAEAVGKNFFELDYPAELARRLQCQIQQVIDSRQPVRDETPYTSAVGERQYEYIFVPVMGANGNVEAVAGSTRDITEKKRIEEELRYAAGRLVEADRRKDEFIATLAHELRNPLAPLRNGLQLIRMAEGDPVTFEAAHTMMERQLHQMVRLIDDLMDVSRINQGKLELRRQRVDLASVLASALESSRPLIEQMGQDLQVALPWQPILLDADPIRLSQVFMNLLNNAAKYSDRSGSIRVTAEREGHEVLVSVRDSGIGIAADQLARIFEMFSQVDRSLERSQGGLGIGLSLVKSLVEMHGGTIEARSEGPGKGAEFAVRIPVAADTSAPPEREIQQRQPRTSLRILVVDDSRDGADSLSMMLRIMGNDLRTAYDGREAVAVAQEFRPHVILLDIGLPKLNGYEACRLIRALPESKDALIIAQTGWGQDADRHKTREAGFDDHLVKPIDTVALMKLLADLERRFGE